MSSREFNFWCRYYSERPFCAEGAFHLPVAQLSSLFANANRAKNSRPAKVSDFLIYRRQVVPDDDIDAQLMSGKW